MPALFAKGGDHMTLLTYRKKRDFSETPEPKGGKSKKGNPIFVIQKHRATRLHYDLRLESGGVLKSWAIPKGPSINPKDKRLAVETEDHPYDYASFEGVIPKGNYGAGTVEIWDNGTYKLLSENMDEAYDKGHIKVEFFGKILTGIYSLNRTQGNNWLFIRQKENREFPPFPERLSSDNQTLEFTNLDKEIFPGITKSNFLSYYGLIAENMLPHVVGRPLTLVRFPNGVDGEKFFQKDLSKSVPKWFQLFEDDSSKKTEYGVLEDLQGLLFIANLVPEIHTWQSTVENDEHPDKMVFDFDPSETNLNLLKDCVESFKLFLEKIGLHPFLMTTGGKGYHVVVPIKPEFTQEEVRSFAEKIGSSFVASNPEKLTMELLKKKRENKIFVDTNRNSPKQTSIAPYSVRARPNAPIAMPIYWQEIVMVDPDSYTLFNFPQRKDPWKDFSKKAVSLKKVIKKLTT